MDKPPKLSFQGIISVTVIIVLIMYFLVLPGINPEPLQGGDIAKSIREDSSNGIK